MSIRTVTTALQAVILCTSILSSQALASQPGGVANSSNGDLLKVVPSQNSTDVPQYDVFEITLQHEGTYENPFFDVSIDVTSDLAIGQECTSRRILLQAGPVEGTVRAV